jgi:hypothetical protein
VLDRQVEQIAAAVDGEDAELIVATMLGLRVARQLLAMTALKARDAQQVAESLRPALEISE